MGKEPMFNGVVFGQIGRVVCDPNFTPNFIHQTLEVALEEVLARVVAAAPVTQDQDRSRLRVVELPLVVPPIAEAITGKFAGILANAEVEITRVPAKVVDRVRNDDAVGKTGKIMVIGLERLLAVGGIATLLRRRRMS